MSSVAWVWRLLKYWFSNRIYVANAYGDTILVMVDADRIHVCNASCQFKVGAAGCEYSQTSDIYHIAESHGFTAIASRSETFFEPKSTAGTVYISIYKMENEKPVKICKALPLNTNRSVIVDKNGFVRNTEKDQIWVDQSGKDHREWEEEEGEQGGMGEEIEEELQEEDVMMVS